MAKYYRKCRPPVLCWPIISINLHTILHATALALCPSLKLLYAALKRKILSSFETAHNNVNLFPLYTTLCMMVRRNNYWPFFCLLAFRSLTQTMLCEMALPVCSHHLGLTSSVVALGRFTPCNCIIWQLRQASSLTYM